MVRRMGRLVAALVLSAAAGGLVVGAAAPAAQARGLNCTLDKGTASDPGHWAEAYAYLDCVGYQDPLPVTLTQYPPSDPSGKVVASGSGDAVYYCVGSTYTKYSGNSGSTYFYADCD